MNKLIKEMDAGLATVDWANSDFCNGWFFFFVFFVFFGGLGELELEPLQVQVQVGEARPLAGLLAPAATHQPVELGRTVLGRRQRRDATVGRTERRRSTRQGRRRRR